MNWRRGLALVGALLVVVLLAFPLRVVANQVILVPLAYILWLLKMLYVSLDQSVWWLLLALALLFFLGQSLLLDFKPSKKMISYERREQGSVEVLARAMQRSKRGTYFKWMVANRLGKVAYQILLQREHGKPRALFAPLTAEGWDAPPEVQAYLEKGLHGSFAEFPTQNVFITKPEKTPLDHDVHEVIGFLESKLEDQ